MRLRKDWYKSDGARLLFAIGLNLVLLLAVKLFCVVRYFAGDDMSIQLFLDGQLAEKTPFDTFCNFFLANVLIWIYNLVGNAIPVYTLFLYGMMFAGFTMICFVLYKRLDVFTATAAGIFLLSSFGAHDYLSFSFTKVAGVCTVAGVGLVFQAVEEEKTWYRRLLLAVGILTAAVGLMIRYEIFCVCLGLLFPLGLYELIRRIRGAEKARFRAVVNYALPFVLLLAVTGGLFLGDQLIWANSRYGEYREFQTEMSNLVDFHGGVPRYESMPEVYDGLGLNEYAVNMARGYDGFMDVDRWDTETFQTIIQARAQRQNGPDSGEILKTLGQCFRVFARNLNTYGVVLSLLLFLCYGRREWLAWMAVALELLILSCVYCILIYNGRYLYVQLDQGFFLAISFLLLWLTRGGSGRVRRLLCLVLAVQAVRLGVLNSRYTSPLYPGNNLVDSSFSKQQVQMIVDDEHLFIETGGIINYMIYSPLETLPEGLRDSIVFTGGWTAQHPSLLDVLEKNGMENIYRDSVNNDRVYWLAPDIEAVVDYVRSYYDPQTRAELVQPLSGQLMIDVYRLVSG